ncbi:ATP/GTP-binding protein [Streptomyces sp. NPDC046324]|uniref:ATP/GTP-binding protein n=1 Tax=Streptomyces sp. NPDC046324 TaxID=3154915 RepID=UPI00340C6C39
MTTLVLAAPAYADPPPGSGGADCGIYMCEVDVDVPGSGGIGTGGTGAPSNGGEGGSEGARDKPATQPVCTYRKLDPQPPAGSLDWEGHEPGDGAVYEERCTYDSGPNPFTVARNVWAATPPAATVDPAVLAKRAVDQMILRGPAIGITPKPGGRGVVGMPVYLWTERGPETYGPNTASASAGGVTVTAAARVSKIVWNMGDGKSVTCTTPGTPYVAEYGKKPSPDCGHRYNTPSATTSSGKFHVTATSTWSIDWQATTGQSGQLTESRTSAVDITVVEVQVLN